MKDTFFRVMVLLLLAGFLVVYYLDSQNDRYQFKEGQSSISVFDKQRGILYVSVPLENGITWLAIDVVNGKTVSTSEQKESGEYKTGDYKKYLKE